MPMTMTTMTMAMAMTMTIPNGDDDDDDAGDDDGGDDDNDDGDDDIYKLHRRVWKLSLAKVTKLRGCVYRRKEPPPHTLRSAGRKTSGA
eukprot:8535488-Pyramimonas_sp.AAC.1